MAEDRHFTLLDLSFDVTSEPGRDWKYPIVLPRYWRSGKFPLHECVDQPELPCPACIAASKSLR